MKTIITLTTIPPRFNQTAKNLDYMLKNIKNDSKSQITVILNLPRYYKRFKPNPLGRHQLKSIRDPRLIINENVTDLGPITKIIPTLEYIASQPQNPIILIIDDEKYHPDAITRMIQTQMDELFVVHSYWVYNYNDNNTIQVPQGVDIIAINGTLLHDLENFYGVFAKDCVLVDDLLLAKYFQTKGIPVKQVPRFWKWPWIPTHSGKNSLLETTDRNSLMKKCYDSFK